jgi:hypothetical protein
MFNYELKTGYFGGPRTSWVGGDFETLITDNNFIGNDVWNLLGVLDLRGTSGNLGGQATAGIIKGTWTGTNLSVGVRSQAENYSGRPGAGVAIGASGTDGVGAPFDNSWETGVHISAAYLDGIRISNYSSVVAHIPTYAFRVFDTSDVEKVVIKSNGAMALGTPTGGVLAAGTINLAADIYKNNTAYTNPDFVFEHFYRGEIVKFADRERAKDYGGLMPLKDLRRFTQSNLRLPRIEDGPAGMFARGDIALEKIEEAHLYILELYDRLEVLESKLH